MNLLYKKDYSRRSSYLPLLIDLIFVIITIILTFGLNNSLNSNSLPGNIDGWFNLFVLEHGFQNMISDSGIMDRFYEWKNPDIFYPTRGTLAWSVNWIIFGSIYNFFRLWFGEIACFKTLLALCLAANFYSLKKFTLLFSKNFYICSIATFVSVCSYTSVARIGHAQLCPQFFGIMAITFFYKYLFYKKECIESRANLYWFIVCGVFQLLSSFYAGVFYIVYASSSALAFLSFELIISLKRKESIYMIIKNFNKIVKTQIHLFFDYIFTSFVKLSVFLMLGVLLVFNYYPYYLRAKEKGLLRDWGDVRHSLMEPYSFLYTKVGGIFVENMGPIPIEAFKTNPTPWEHSGFPGYLQYFLLSIAFVIIVLKLIMRIQTKMFALNSARMLDWKSIDSKILFLIASCALSFIICSKFTIFGTQMDPWYFLWKYIPGFGAIRSVTRASSTFMVLLAPAYAYSLSHIFCAFAKYKINTFIVSFVLAITVFINLPLNRDSDLTSPFFSRVNELSELVQEQDCESFFNQAQPGVVFDPWRSQLVGMWVMLKTNVPTLSGYSGDFPDMWSPYMSKEEAIDFIDNRKLKSWDKTKFCFYTNK